MSRNIDVWLVEANTVYKGVPFTVVADWIQQNRVLEGDRLRTAGATDWVRVADSPDFSVYLPRPTEFQAEDEAEALEPVELEVHWKRSRQEEDDEVDMVPLIDVSLVLLIFFILTSVSSSAGAGTIQTPETVTGLVNTNQELIWIGMDIDRNHNNAPIYSIGRASGPPLKGDMRNRAELLAELDNLLPQGGGRVEVSLRAHEEIPSGEVRDMTLELARRRGQVSRTYVEVREKR